MADRPIGLTGVERTFPEHELIVSKTNPKGFITYGNDIFIDMSGFTERELLGAPHNIIRHPHMPKCIFKLLWDVIQGGGEIFAYVVNRAKNGDHYWVYAHVTPWLDKSGTIEGYHSNRRVASRSVVKDVIEPTYAKLLSIEQQHLHPKEAMAASTAILLQAIEDAGFPSYDEFIHSFDD